MAIYHFTAKSAGRLGGQSAEAALRYICKEGKYKRSGDVVAFVASVHMPPFALVCEAGWARDGALQYWRAADEYERANGRLFKGLEFALPDQLSLAANIALARRYLDGLTAGIEGGALPYTFAIHAKLDPKTGELSHFHVHALVSERVNDGVERSADTWFRRVAVSRGPRMADPATGGAKKSTALRPEGWLLAARLLWAKVANEALTAAGLFDRIDHRSLKDQGLDRMPEPKLGPRAKAMEHRTAKPTFRGERMRAVRLLRESKSAAVAAEDEAARLEAEHRVNVAADAERRRKLHASVQRARCALRALARQTQDQSGEPVVPTVDPMSQLREAMARLQQVAPTISDVDVSSVPGDELSRPRSAAGRQ